MLTKKTATLGLVGAVLAGAAVTGLSSASAAPQDAAAAPAADTATQMPSAVEDFQYPGAAQILKDRQITLKQGDGHILLKPQDGSSCSASNEILVDSRLSTGGYCFTVTGTTGYLTMEVPKVYAIWTEDHPVAAKIKVIADGTEKGVTVPKNDWVQVGEGDTTTGSKPSVLLELRVTG